MKSDGRGVCLICAGSIDTNCNVKNVRDAHIFSLWKNECAGALCNILFDCGTHSLFNCFKNSEYCNSCQQIIRDINFTYRQLQEFEKKLNQQTDVIWRRISRSYSRVKKRYDENSSLKEDIVGVTEKCKMGVSLNLDDYAHEELVEIIYTVALPFVTRVPITEYNSEDENDECNSSEQRNPTDIKIEPFKMENDEEFLCCSANESDGGDLDWHLKTDNVDEQAGNRKRKRRRKDNKNALEDSQLNVDKILSLRKRKKRKCSSNLAKIKRKEMITADEDTIRKQRRSRKLEKESLKPKGNEGNVKCTLENCSLTFRTEEKMRTHVRGFHEGEEKPYKCAHTHCSESFETWKALVSHRKYVHDKRKRKSCVCKFCGKGYDIEEELQNHYSVAHVEDNPFNCAFCSEVYSNSVHLRLHVKKVHPDPEDLMKPHCKICDKYFSNQNNFNMHIKWQHGSPEKIPTCSQCNRQFSSKGALKKHSKRYHTQEIKYTCESCGKGFNYLGDLNEHKKVHDENNKKYACKICDRKFASSETCKLHEVTHTDIKEFVCQFCGKAFSRKGNLNVHIKLHSDERENPLKIRKPKRKTISTIVEYISISDLSLSKNVVNVHTANT